MSSQDTERRPRVGIIRHVGPGGGTLAAAIAQMLAHEGSKTAEDPQGAPYDPRERVFLVRNPNHRPSEEGTFKCTCESYPHETWCGRWMRPVPKEADRA